MRSNTEAVVGGDAVSAELTALLARLGALADQPTDPGGPVPDGRVSDAARVDRIALLERVRSAVAAAQHTEMVAFARSQIEAQLADDRVDPRAVGRGIADQIALACHVSPWSGSRRWGIARALAAELPATRALLVAGRISEDLAEHVVAQTPHLDPEQRRAVDSALGGMDLEGMGRQKAEAAVKKAAYEADRAGYTRRGRTARTDRRVTLRPAPDTMSVLSGFLSVEQGAACLAALSKHAEKLQTFGDGDTRTRDQIMADTPVERVTGKERAADVDVEVGLLLPLDALHPTTATGGTAGDGTAEAGAGAGVGAGAGAGRGGSASAEMVGYGPIPADIARDILSTSQGRHWWRRLFTAPASGPDNTGALVGGALVGGDPRRRRFDGFLATLIGIRDHGRCRDPYCDAPIRHLDHIHHARSGGPTSYTNGRGVCARGNYVREMPDWHLETLHDGLHGPPHTVRTTTPTGHTYTSRVGPAP